MSVHVCIQCDYSSGEEAVLESIHQLEEIILKVIQTMLFLCAFSIIAVVWTLLSFNIEKDF